MAHTSNDPNQHHVSRPAPVAPIGKAMVITLSVVTLLATVLCAMRVIGRKRKGYLGLDDWTLLFALVLLYAQDALNFVAALKGGVGVPIAELEESSIDSLKLLFVILYACEVIYSILMYTLKMSILISYDRVFGVAGWVGWAIKGMFGLVTVWFLTTLFMFCFQCRPIAAAWKPLEVHGSCINLIDFIWGMSITNFVLDWMILFLPILPVLKLQMSALQKALVIGSFLLGSIACVASTTRAALTVTLNGGDLSKSGAMVMIWTVIEPACGIISACLPFLTRLFGRYLRGTWSHVAKFTGGSSRQPDDTEKDNTYVLNKGQMVAIGEQSTARTPSPAEYEMHRLHGTERHGEGQESVKNLIP